MCFKHFLHILLFFINVFQSRKRYYLRPYVLLAYQTNLILFIPNYIYLQP